MMRRAKGVQLAGVLIAAVLGMACASHRSSEAPADSAIGDGSSDARSLATEPRDRNGAEAPAAATTKPTSARRRPRIMFIGTSLTAGYGLGSRAEAFPEVVGRMLAAKGKVVDVLNLGVSGETSAGARSRIDWVLRQPADVIVLETGANDGLRGLPVKALRENIQVILDRVRAARPNARVLLVQMEAPPNFGARYTEEFRAVFPELARENGIELVPFLLAGVAGDPSMNQADGIHPNPEGARVAARAVYDVLIRKPLVVTND